MEPDYTAKPWNIIADEQALARQEAARQAVLAESPFHTRKPSAVPGGDTTSSAGAVAAVAGSTAGPAAGPADSVASTFRPEDMDELLTPLPRQVLERGMYVLRARARVRTCVRTCVRARLRSAGPHGQQFRPPGPRTGRS